MINIIYFNMEKIFLSEFECVIFFGWKWSLIDGQIDLLSQKWDCWIDVDLNIDNIFESCIFEIIIVLFFFRNFQMSIKWVYCVLIDNIDMS